VTGVHVEYVGFTAQAKTRAYTLRIRQGLHEPHDVTLTIPNEAFLTRRVRYQDGPEICFLKLQRELAACVEGLPGNLQVTDADLAEYKAAHTPAKR
jgi:hypothetical protein